MNIFEFKPIKKKKPKYYGKIVVKVESGDGDAPETVTIHEKTEEGLLADLRLLFDIRNFIPNDGFKGLGYYEPVTDREKIAEIAKKHHPDYKYPADIVADLIGFDAFNDSQMRCIQDIKVFVGGKEVFVKDPAARRYNPVVLPSIGETLPIISADYCSRKGMKVGRYQISKEPLSGEGEVVAIYRLDVTPHYDLYGTIVKVGDSYACICNYGHEEGHDSGYELALHF